LNIDYRRGMGCKRMERNEGQILFFATSDGKICNGFRIVWGLRWGVVEVAKHITKTEDRNRSH